MNKTTAGLSGLPSSKVASVGEGVKAMKQLNFGTTKPPAKRSIVMPTRTGRTVSYVVYHTTNKLLMVLYCPGIRQIKETSDGG
jgi:hypothetical protein